KREHGGGAHEGEPLPLQGRRQRPGFGGLGGYLLHGPGSRSFCWLEAPHEIDQATLVAQAEGGPRVGDGGADLALVADDGRVVEKLLDASLTEPGYLLRVEITEGGAEGGALAQDRRPGQA